METSEQIAKLQTAYYRRTSLIVTVGQVVLQFIIYFLVGYVGGFEKQLYFIAGVIFFCLLDFLSVKARHYYLLRMFDMSTGSY